MTWIGAGVKQRTKMASVPSAIQRRVRSSGTCTSSVGGCRGPSRKSIPTISAAQTIQLSERRVSATMRTTPPNDIWVEREPKQA